MNEIKYEPWKVVRRIGKGSFGSVYEIEREEFGETYTAALKVISIPQSEREIIENRSEGMNNASMTSYYQGVVKELTHEFSILSKLKGQTNIVGYEDHKVVPHDDGIGWDIYIRMELLTSLTTVSSCYNLSRNQVVKLGIDICNALVLCQNKGIIHRDIKPDNIFVSENGDFELGDFGVARIASQNGTMYNMSKKGTPNYMAPEVFWGKPYNAEVDIYSLGIVLYQLMNQKRLPFIPKQMTMKDKEDALGKRMKGEALPAPQSADAEFAKIILKACSYDPKKRYASAEEMRKDLEAIQGNPEPVPVKDIVGGTIDPEIRVLDLAPDPVQDSVPTKDSVSVQDSVPVPPPDKKPNQKIILGIAAGVIVVLLAIIFAMGRTGSEDEISKEDTEAATEAATETATEADTESDQEETSQSNGQTESVSLADASWDDYMFELEGVTYKLPMTYQDFVDTGWVMMHNSESDVMEANRSSFYTFSDGKKTVSIELYNYSANNLTLKECKIGGITVTADEGDIDFKMAKNLTLNSTYEEVTEALGTPSSKNKGSTALTIVYGESSANTKFVFDEEDESYPQITIEYCAMTEDDITEVSTDVPEYLSEYVAPTTMSEDPADLCFELDGVLYQLPCPVSEFINNGWEIAATDEPSLAAEEYSVGGVQFEKDGNTITLGIWNYDTVANTIENCAVGWIDFYKYTGKTAEDDKENIDSSLFKSYNGITLSTPEDGIESLCSDFEVDDYTNSSGDYVKTFSYVNTFNSREMTITWYEYSENDGYRKTELEIHLRADDWRVEGDSSGGLSIIKKKNFN